MTRWLLLLILVSGCAASPPRQLGGLAMFNPRGIEARLFRRLPPLSGERVVKTASGRDNGASALFCNRGRAEVREVCKE